MTAATAFKILTQQQWADFERERVFRGAPVDIADGYIHLSTAEQLEGTIAKYFADCRPLMIAEVEGDRVAAMNSYLDVQTLFPQYGLALVLDPA